MPAEIMTFQMAEYPEKALKFIGEELFSLKFKQLICLIKKFSLSLRFYIDNIFDL